MNQQIARSSLALGACALLFATLFGTSCEQPPFLCETASGPYAMKYFPKDPGNDCLGLAGEYVGMSVYNPPKGDDRQIDATRATIAVQVNSMGVLVDEALNLAQAQDANREHNLYALGDYTTRPDANTMCRASNMAPAEQIIPETAYTDKDGNSAVFPETRLVHEWKDLQLYMPFEAPGNAAMGEVTTTREVKDPMTGMIDSCTVTYVAIGLYPPAKCESAGNAGMPDDSLCCANADPAAGRQRGSGIHPNFRTKCDPKLLQCVLDWQPGDSFPPLGGNPTCK